MNPGRVLVLGGGIAGLATAWALARRGVRDVVLVEREAALGMHATAQNAAILRTPMPDGHGEALARVGAEFLRAPPRDFTDRPLLDACGLLLVVEKQSANERTWIERIAARASDVIELDAREIERIAPHVRSDNRRAFLLAREGKIDVPALVAGFARGARAAGVRFELGAEVARILPRGRGVRLVDGRVIAAERTVLAAGAWAARLARDVGSRIELRPTRRHLFVSKPDARVDPRWPIVWTDDDPFYARPERGGLMLCACDEVDVEPIDLAARIEELESTRTKARRVLRDLDDLAAARFWAGIRTHTSDGRFAIGPDPDVPALVWAGGLGGHGVTCAGPVGLIAADWVVDLKSDHPLARELDPARFIALGADVRAR